MIWRFFVLFLIVTGCILAFAAPAEAGHRRCGRRGHFRHDRGGCGSCYGAPANGYAGGYSGGGCAGGHCR